MQIFVDGLDVGEAKSKQAISPHSRHHDSRLSNITLHSVKLEEMCPRATANSIELYVCAHSSIMSQ